MKYLFVSLLAFLSFTAFVCAQRFNKSINKDSLLQTILKDLPKGKKQELLKIYNDGNEQSKEFFLVMFSMPKSSKNALISNIDSNFENITILKSSYSKLVPKNYIVSIEFNPADIITMTKETIDLKIEQINKTDNDIKQEWNLEYKSKKLQEMLGLLNWTNETLITIKKLLSDANCVSIENGDITTIGFARSGMGKYYFKLFDNDLTAEQIKQYNDGCTYIYYKKNIVLEYGGGAIGSECFPD
jgi:hypothetical protein